MLSLKYLISFMLFFIIFISFTDAQSIAWIFPRSLNNDDSDKQPTRLVRRDRPCLINAGLSQGCDLSDMMYAKFQASKFSSFAGPGK